MRTPPKNARRDDDDQVTLLLGNLAAFGSPGNNFNVDKIDLSTLILGLDICPSSTRIRHGERDEVRNKDADHRGEGFQGPFLEAKFNRKAVLALLPGLQTTRPLAPGDTLSLTFDGKMENGLKLHGAVTVRIVGDRDDDHDHK